MQFIGIKLNVSNANAIASSTVIGLPTPAGFSGYVTALIIEALDKKLPLRSLAMGFRDFRMDRHGSSVSLTRGAAVMASGKPHAAGAIYDHVNSHFKVSLIAEVDIPAEEALIAVQAMNQVLPHVPCIGGSVDRGSNVQCLEDSQRLDFMKGCRLLQDKTGLLGALAKSHEKTSVDVLMDICFRGGVVGKDHVPGPYEAEISELGYMVPTVVGYRAIEAPRRDRTGVRRSFDESAEDLPHCFGECVTGIAEVVSAWRADKNLSGFWWRPEITPSSFLMKGC